MCRSRGYMYLPFSFAVTLKLLTKILCKEKNYKDFPGGSVVKNPPSNAGDAGSIPGRGTKIPHATGQLSLRTTTTEPSCHSWREACALLLEKPSCHSEEPICHNERSHVPQLRPDAAK